MRLLTWFFLTAAPLISTPATGQQSSGMVQILSAADFLKLPSDIQGFFVGGLIEGTAFTLYGYGIADYPAWAACVRQKTLGDTTSDVVAFLKQTPNFPEGVGSALAQTLGRRCKH
jgi:hypothetical protein